MRAWRHPMSSVRPASVDQPGSSAFSCRGKHAAQLADRLLLVGQLPEQAARQLVEGGHRAGAEGPRFGCGLGEDVFVRDAERACERLVVEFVHRLKLGDPGSVAVPLPTTSSTLARAVRRFLGVLGCSGCCSALAATTITSA